MDVTEPTTPVIPDYPLPDLVLGAEAKYFLNTAGRWASFLGILGFILTGIIVIFALIAGSIFSMMGAYQADREPSMMTGMWSAFASFAWIFYLAFAVLNFFFSFYLYNFGAKIKAGTTFNDNLRVTQAVSSLKSFFKLWGIITIIAIVFYVLILIGVIIFAASMHTAMTSH